MAVALETNIYSYTENKLHALSQKSAEFNRQLGTLNQIYQSSFDKFLREEDKERFTEDFFSACKSQIFNGFFIFREILLNDNKSISDTFFEQPDGAITVQIPELINQAAGEDVYQVIITEQMSNLTSWMVTQYEDVLPLLREVAYSCVCLGFKWAILDEREQRGVNGYKAHLDGLLGKIDDLEFINPINYISCIVVNEQTEKWEIYKLGHEDLHKIGEVYILNVDEQTGYNYLMSIYLLQSETTAVQQYLVDSLAVRFMTRNGVERGDVLITFAGVEQFYQLID